MEENRMGVGEPISGWEGLSEEVAFECWGSISLQQILKAYSPYGNRFIF